MLALLGSAFALPAAASAVEAVPPVDGPFRLAPPERDGPVVVRALFDLHDVNEIDDVAETFEFTGVMTLEWKDPREAFDPAQAGVREKVYTGRYQFNEIATGWYPEVVLANASGASERSGVVLRVQPDGTSTLNETITAVAETDVDMRLFPFDSRRLEAIFHVLGFDRDEVVLVADPSADQGALRDVRVPQWSVTSIAQGVGERPVARSGGATVVSTFVLAVHAERNSLYIRRLITFPMAVIVVLSFSVFWMDRSSLGDRNNVSFIGILTGVAYQLVMGDVMPPTSYFTVMHGFLFLSFMTMSATVAVNLIVASMDKKGEDELGDRIDHRCRWIFPVFYFGTVLTGTALAVALLGDG